ncbi:hypothetical protein GA0061084_0361 [Arthrobacter sp. NIO-1057]|nr:hypothetical protein GA0061084_0361 [Arthrobacter sp. NIO-1057]
MGNRCVAVPMIGRLNSLNVVTFAALALHATWLGPFIWERTLLISIVGLSRELLDEVIIFDFEHWLNSGSY